MSVFILILGLMSLTAGVIYMIVRGFNKSLYDNKMSNKPIIALMILGIVLITISQAFVIIPTGYTGVKTTFGQVSEDIARPGFNAKIPFVMSIEKVNNKQQDITLAGAGDILYAEAKGKIPVMAANLTVTYKINPQKSSWIYANVTDYKGGLITSSLVSSAFKAASVTLGVEEVTVRSIIEPLTTTNLQALLDEKYGKETVILTRVVIGNMDFEESYNNAINEKNKAQQEYERAQTQNKQAFEKAENEAAIRILEAESKANADTARILIEAEAHKTAAVIKAETTRINSEAEAVRYAIISGAITDELLKKWEADARIAHGWVTVKSDAVITDVK